MSARFRQKGFNALDVLAKVAAKVASIRIDTGGVDREKHSNEYGNSAEIKATVSAMPSLLGTSKADAKRVAETDQTFNYDLVEKHHVIFNEVRVLLEQAIIGQQLDRIYILLDEWSATPSSCQPYLAEYIKRCLLTSSRVVLKIASLEYRSDFSIRTDQNNVLGFELGADYSGPRFLDHLLSYT